MPKSCLKDSSKIVAFDIKPFALQWLKTDHIGNYMNAAAAFQFDSGGDAIATLNRALILFDSNDILIDRECQKLLLSHVTDRLELLV